MITRRKIFLSLLTIATLISIFESCSNRLRQRIPNTITLADITTHADTILEKDGPYPAVFTPAQLDTLKNALAIANKVITDTLFTGILAELENNDWIDWGRHRLALIPAEHHNAPAAFILQQFATRGLNKLEDFKAYRWNTNSSTTGSVNACDTLPKVNVNKLDRGIRSIAGTMVHERVHSFCQQHISQQRNENICDMAYHAGTLTIALSLYRDNNSQPVRAGIDLCRNLRNVLSKRGVLK